MEAAMMWLFFDFFTHEEVKITLILLNDMRDKSQIKI